VPTSAITYFSMEIGLECDLPTYSGGLGILAGDTLRAAADLGLSLIGITLAHRRGYFRQALDARGNQSESPAPWEPEGRLGEVPARAQVPLRGRPVHVRAWHFRVRGLTGREVPVYLLDTDLPENDPADRRLTDHLYGGDAEYRLCQEAVLGLGGLAVLRALGHGPDAIVYHMNEGHSALLTLGLLEELGGPSDATREAVRRRCVFTIHTPVSAGHDKFPLSLVRSVLGPARADVLAVSDLAPDDVLNMTELALRHAHYVNGVALQHERISRGMFPRYPINSVTNGVHSVTWTAEPIRALFDRHIPEWRRDNLYLRHACSIPLDEIRDAHAACKAGLIAEVERRAGIRLDPNALTLGFARRATAYKRADLLFTGLDRLRRIARTVGPLQVVYAGKAHPHDNGGKEQIRRVFAAAEALRGAVTVVYLPGYEMALGRVLCAGADVWLNTPQKPQEASGTGGMKAAVNGVPSLSILDGWWLEGWIEGVTGWAIGEDGGRPSDPAAEAASLYDKLEGGDRPNVPPPAGRTCGCDAVGDGDRWVVLQRRADGHPVRAERPLARRRAWPPGPCAARARPVPDQDAARDDQSSHANCLSVSGPHPPGRRPASRPRSPPRLSPGETGTGRS
jgi:starch phosphorylase